MLCHSPSSLLTFLFVHFLISRTQAQEPEVSPNGHIRIWYPSSNAGINGSILNINVIDTLVLSYESTFDYINASMWCLMDEKAQRYNGLALQNPLSGTNSYAIHDLNQSIAATQFPLPCHFSFVDSSNSSDKFAGGTYMMVSTAGPLVTRSYVASATPQKTLSTSTVDTNPTTTTSTSGMPTPTQSTTPDPNKATKSIVLSKAGIAGIVVGFVSTTVLICILLCVWRERRKSKRVRDALLKIEGKHEPHSNSINEADSRLYASELIRSGAPVVIWKARGELQGSEINKTAVSHVVQVREV